MVHHLASDGTAYPYWLSAFCRSGMGEQRRKFLVAFAIQQDCATLCRHHFKDEFQDLRLQLVEVRNGMDHAADFQQRVQVPPQPRSRRQFPQHSFRLKVENILRAHLRGGLGQSVVKFDAVRGRFIRVLFQQEHKNRFANRDLVPVVQLFFRDDPAVYECAIAAVQIAKGVTIRFADEYAVTPGQGEVANRQRVGGIARPIRISESVRR